MRACITDRKTLMTSPLGLPMFVMARDILIRQLIPCRLSLLLHQLNKIFIY